MNLVGIDEVGRGCWAGPLVVVALRATAELPAVLTDSKQLTKAKRELFADMLREVSEWGEGWVWPDEIDFLGLTGAMRLAVERALKNLGAEHSEMIVLDGNYNYCPKEYLNVSCVIKADGSVPEVSAASIIAKVSRDRYMSAQAAAFPDYGFEKHVGYGTSAHADALAKNGVTSIHRRSYKPVQKYLEN